MPIAVVGNVFVDIKGFPAGEYIPGGRNAGSVVTVHGGVGRNVAEDIANVGVGCRFVSMVDFSGEGQSVREKLNKSGVDTNYLVSAKDGMGIWLAVFDHTGEVVAAISKRPDMSSMLRMLETDGDSIFSDVDSIVIEIDLDEEIVKETFIYAKKYGIPVFGLVANMTIASERTDYIRQTDCFICNEEEAEILFHADYSGMCPKEICDAVAVQCEEFGVRSIIVTLAGNGAVYVSAGGERGCIPANQIPVQDTTGAGDAFCAGAAVGLSYGLTLRRAVEVGTELASEVITIPENTCPAMTEEKLDLLLSGTAK